MGLARILVIDDETLMREYVEEALNRAGYFVMGASNGADGVQLLRDHTFDVLLTDLKMSPMDGLEVLRYAASESPETLCIMMTAYGTVETAVNAMKSGAVDYILKPFTPDALEMVVERVLNQRNIVAENKYLREAVASQYDFTSMIGKAPSMRAVYEQIEKVAASKATILIRGETGTGKELVARAIHHAGPRKDKPFIKVNCAALSAGLLESELFGHEKGSFTGAHERKIGRFELASGGTLLLDEISEMNLDLQPKLLRALQEREIERVGGSQPISVDTRIVATSNRNLEESVENGAFRQDLFYRLQVIPLHLPPLRERRDDIELLMEHFLRRFNEENGLRVEGFTEAARALFMAYDWPGNVRELQNAIERAVVLAGSPRLAPSDFPMLVQGGPSLSTQGAPVLKAGMTVAQMERQLIFQTLKACDDNRTQAAKQLGISVRTLRNKLHEYAAETTG